MREVIKDYAVNFFQLCLFLGIGAKFGYFMLDSVLGGAALGLVVYLLIVLLFMFGDIVAINRELAAFRQQREAD